jgi:hypothetical protein
MFNLDALASKEIDKILNKNEYKDEQHLDDKIAEASANLKESQDIIRSIQYDEDRHPNSAKTKVKRSGYNDRMKKANDAVLLQKTKHDAITRARELSKIIDKRNDFFENASTVGEVLEVSQPSNKKEYEHASLTLEKQIVKKLVFDSKNLKPGSCLRRT